MKLWCICCGNTMRLDPHHRHPQSQGGKDVDENKVKACRDCHSLYHAICGQGLAKLAKDRVKN